MRKIGFVILVLLLLATLASIPKHIALGGNPEIAGTASSRESGLDKVESTDSLDVATKIGDLQHSAPSGLKTTAMNLLSTDITGNTTYTMANGTFVLNDIIVVKENATLVIENALVKFNSSSRYIIETYDNASLIVKNATIYHLSGYAYMCFYDFTNIAIEGSCLRQIYAYLYDNSDVSIETSVLTYSLYMYDYSEMSMASCRASYISAYSHSAVSIEDCNFSYLTVYDSAIAFVSDSMISTGVSIEFDRNSSASLSFPRGLVNHWNLYEDNAVATSYINLTLIQTRVYLWSLSVSDISSISVVNSQLDSFYVYDNSTVSIDHSSLNYLGAYEFSNTSIVDSSISQRIYVEFWYNSNLSLSLTQGYIPYWNLYLNSSFANAFIDLTLKRTSVNSWYLYAYSSSIILTNSKVDYICNYYNSSLTVQGSTVSGVYNYDFSELIVSLTTLSYLYTYELSEAFVEASTLRYVYAYENSSISVKSSQIDYLGVHDYATLSINDSIILYQASMSFLADSDISFDSFPVGSIQYWNLYANATVGTGYINLTIEDTFIREWGTITASSSAKLSLDNCVLENLYLYGNSTAALSNSLVDYLYAYDYANTSLSNSAVAYFCFSLRGDSDVSFASLHSSRIGYWNLYVNETVGRAYVNHTIFNSWVKAWSIYVYDRSVVSVQDSTLETIYCYGSSTLNLKDSVLNNVYGYDSSIIEIENCTISYLGGYNQCVISVNGSTIRYNVYCYDDSSWTIEDSSILSRFYLEFEEASLILDVFSPKGLISHWSLDENTTVARKFVSVNLVNTTVYAWRFYVRAFSKVSFSNSAMEVVYTYNLSNATFRNCSVETLYTYGGSCILVENILDDQSSLGYLYAYDTSNVKVAKSSVGVVYAYQYSYIELVGSFYGSLHLADYARALVRWFLEVHVVDSIGQNVPAANVSVRFVDNTLADSTATDSEGMTTFVLSEKALNATYEHVFGNYNVSAVYDSHIKNATVNMTKNRQITLSLQDFTVPELSIFIIVPLVLSALVVIAIYRKRIWSSKKDKPAF